MALHGKHDTMSCTRARKLADTLLGEAKGNMTCDGKQPTRILPWLWLGCARDARNDAWMRAQGITHVVNCISGASAPRAPNSFRRYVQLNAQDTDTYPLFQAVPKFRNPNRMATNWDLVRDTLDDAAAAYARDGKSSALVYCAAGLNRSATLVVAYVALTTNRRAVDVARRIKAKRQGALSNPNFIKQLAHVLVNHDLTKPCRWQFVGPGFQ